MAEIFGAPQPSDGNGELRVSLFQGLVNAMRQSTECKQQALDIVRQLDSWLVNSMQRDIMFADKLVQAIEDNSQHIDSSLMEGDIKKIAGKFGANGDNAQ